MNAMAGALRPLATGDGIGHLVATEGSATHEHVRYLTDGSTAQPELADAVHFLTLLHGRYPGVIDNAADRAFHPAAREWMFRAAAGYAAERAFLTRLVVVAGSMPSTLGQAHAENAVLGQAQALSTLSQSERRGTALGAAFAVALEWQAVRRVIDVAARHFGVSPPPADLPRPVDTEAVVAAMTDEAPLARALSFGAQQLVLQHRGLWDLLASRTVARARR